MNNLNICLKLARTFQIGLFFASKYQLQAQDTNVERAARNLRKQGVPLQIALLILAYK